MKAILLGALLAAGMIWGLPKVRARLGGVKFAATPSLQAQDQDRKQHESIRDDKPPGGPGDRLLPRVRQLEEQLRKFKNKHRSKE